MWLIDCLKDIQKEMPQEPGLTHMLATLSKQMNDIKKRAGTGKILEEVKAFQEEDAKVIQKMRLLCEELQKVKANQFDADGIAAIRSMLDKVIQTMVLLSFADVPKEEDQELAATANTCAKRVADRVFEEAEKKEMHSLCDLLEVARNANLSLLKLKDVEVNAENVMATKADVVKLHTLTKSLQKKVGAFPMQSSRAFDTSGKARTLLGKCEQVRPVLCTATLKEYKYHQLAMQDNLAKVAKGHPEKDGQLWSFEENVENWPTAVLAIRKNLLALDEAVMKGWVESLKKAHHEFFEMQAAFSLGVQGPQWDDLADVLKDANISLLTLRLYKTLTGKEDGTPLRLACQEYIALFKDAKVSAANLDEHVREAYKAGMKGQSLNHLLPPQ